ncbi:hypothetical protein D3C76_1587760 [compost metagenome]
MGVEAEEFVAELVHHRQPEACDGAGRQAPVGMLDLRRIDARAFEHGVHPHGVVAQVMQGRLNEVRRYRIAFPHWLSRPDR